MTLKVADCSESLEEIVEKTLDCNHPTLFVVGRPKDVAGAYL